MYVGDGGNGTLAITNGGTVRSDSSYAGYWGAGSVTVDGTGSQFVSTSLGFGSGGGSATLTVTNGGVVSVSGTTSVGYGLGGLEVAPGSLNLETSGGTFTTGSLAVSPAQLTGAGSVSTHGLVTDLNLVFDATHGLKQAIPINSLPSQNVTVNLDLSTPANNGWLGAGGKVPAD